MSELYVVFGYSTSDWGTSVKICDDVCDSEDLANELLNKMQKEYMGMKWEYKPVNMLSKQTCKCGYEFGLTNHDFCPKCGTKRVRELFKTTSDNQQIEENN